MSNRPRWMPQTWTCRGKKLHFVAVINEPNGESVIVVKSWSGKPSKGWQYHCEWPGAIRLMLGLDWK